MSLTLAPLEPSQVPPFKRYAQEAFQRGYEDYFGPTDCVILPEKDIDQSLETAGAAAYAALSDGQLVGGAIVVIDQARAQGDLHFLFVKRGVQNKGIGKFIWTEIERLHPEVRTWETCTPYFDRRNVHFYVNVCHFAIVEYFNAKHPMKDAPDDFVGDAGEGMFGFRKEIKR